MSASIRRINSPHTSGVRASATRAALATLCLACLAPAALAQGQQAQTKPPAPAQPQSAKPAGEGQSAMQKYFTDVELLTQDGKTVRLYSDLLKNKVVVINAFFATCTGICPPMNRNLERVQEAFKDRVGKDLFIISITVDPTTDTPERLKEYAAKFHPVPGRLFVTGKKENVDWALYKLGQYVEDKNSHTSVLIIGNERTGLWKKAFAMAKPEEIVQIVRTVLDDKGAGGN
ncbi:MAG: SCO family protein [Acidobacteria bacterium]|nr:SCO family protein [Acidobacteriota bacterium]